MKPAQKLLSDLINHFTDPSSNKSFKTNKKGKKNLDDGLEGLDILNKMDEEARKEEEMKSRSWEEALAMVASDFSWDDDTENVLVILTSSLIGDRFVLPVIKGYSSSKTSDNVSYILKYEKGGGLVVSDDRNINSERNHYQSFSCLLCACSFVLPPCPWANTLYVMYFLYVNLLFLF